MRQLADIPRSIIATELVMFSCAVAARAGRRVLANNLGHLAQHASFRVRNSLCFNRQAVSAWHGACPMNFGGALWSN